jgi:hypothetical protein
MHPHLPQLSFIKLQVLECLANQHNTHYPQHLHEQIHIYQAGAARWES